MGIFVDINSVFTCQIKRLHEYKRQTLNIFAVIWRYLQIKKATPEERKKMVHHTTIFAGKAAPGESLGLPSATRLTIRLLHRQARHSPDRERRQGRRECHRSRMLADIRTRIPTSRTSSASSLFPTTGTNSDRARGS